MKKILIVEDEEPIRELVKLNLSMVGFDTLEAEDGEKALNLINEEVIDLIVLDIMLPKIDGYELLPHILEKEIPVILLTAKDSLKDKIKGLNLGADDYITKPFEGMELIARINALLRRTNKDENVKSFDDVEIYEEKRKVFKNGKEVELTPKEFELLNLLVDNKGIALSREKILEIIWNSEYEGNTRTVDMHIQRLRHKLDTDKISTVYKIGYRLE
ncbi:response regulator transcription factor [Haloimpatiens sp. FM7315]|uniref:response regulator transcription factor n=1 Tax=Haloimpatiens sp. FM7315 TaxID=3298609 RepID=UPI0035A3141A